LPHKRFLADRASFGGAIIPFITGYNESHLFLMAYYGILSIGIIAISFFQNWHDLRGTSYAAIALFILSSISMFNEFSPKIVSILFLSIIFIIYNGSSLMNVLRRKVDDMHPMDNLILITLPLLVLYPCYKMFGWEIEVFGIFVMIFTFIYLFEIYIFKGKNKKVSESTIYSTLSTGIVLLNLGILAILDSINDDYFMILFMIEFILFSFLAQKVPKNKLYYFFGKISLVLIAIWYGFVVRFDQGFTHALFFLIIILGFAGACYWLFKKDTKDKINAATCIIAGFLFIYSLHKFLWFVGISDIVAQIILSALWLIYTLALYDKAEKEGKTFIGLLLGITLLKIAFRDLLFLTGIFRIVGFIIFGILLIIGGYLIKHEH